MKNRTHLTRPSTHDPKHSPRLRVRDKALAAAAATLASLAAAGGCSPEGSSPGPVPVAEPEVTYWRDVYPIVQRNCVNCHQKDGIGGFDLANPDVVISLASIIAQQTGDGLMPPYLPGPLTPPLKGARRLDDEQKALLAKWASIGAPEGDPSTRGPEILPENPFALGEPDLSFDVTPEPYAPDASISDDYRCFAVPLDIPTKQANIGYRVTPGNPEVVHHLIAYLFDGSALPALQSLDAETDRPGWPCFNQEQLAPPELGIKPNGLLGYWVPGTGEVALPEGAARPVQAGSFAVVNMHYNTAAWDGMTPDQTRFDVFYADPAKAASLQPIQGLPVGIQMLSIPFGEAEVVHERTFSANQWTGGKFGTLYPDGEAWAIGVRAHAHLLAIRHRITLNKGTPDERILLDIPRWDFHWQSSWHYEEPFAIRANDTVTITCVYDNTAEHRLAVGLDPQQMDTVTWGEGSADEMCGGGIELVNSPLKGGEAAVCNTLVNDALDVEGIRSLEALPVGSGGIVADGIYHQEGFTLHTASGAPGPLGYLERVTIAIKGGSWQIVATESAVPELRETKSFTTEGALFTWTRSCPSEAVLKGTYDATPTSVNLYYEMPKGGIVRRLKRVADLP